MDNGIYKNAITGILGFSVGEQSGAWVVKDGEQWRELTAQESADVQVEYDRMYKESIVPKHISTRQARLALLSVGMLGEVETAIAGMASPEREQAQIEWQYASEVFRDNPLIIGMATQLGMNSDQIDQLFIDASKL